MNQDLDPQHEEFARRARALLERSAEDLSGQTRSRLTRARYRALEQHPAARARTSTTFTASWRRALPAGAIAAAVLAVLLLVGHNAAPELQQAAVGGEDLELLADRDALALAQDQASQDADLDYEFYDWAVSAARDSGGEELGS